LEVVTGANVTPSVPETQACAGRNRDNAE